MAVFHERDVNGMKIEIPAAKFVLKKSVVTPETGWEGQVMRIFEIGEGGHTPKHEHPWYHVNYIIEGTGVLNVDGEDYAVEPGSCAYVPEDVMHQFVNTGKGTLKFICIVPEEGDV